MRHRSFATVALRVSAAAGLVALTASHDGAATPKFFPDDPVAAVVDTADASRVMARDIDLTVDTLENLFSWPGDRTPDVRAQNVNSIDEVPDSNWFTNRLGSRPMAIEEILRGSDTTSGPAAGPLTVVAAKHDGVTPGFTVRDAAGRTWFLKVDPPGYRGMATGTEMVVAKLMWALGYHVPELHLARVHPEGLFVSEQAMITPINGHARPLKRSDINALLRRAHRDADGSYRVIASRALEGPPLGGFKFYGRRSDDPNDLFDHEHHRELRGYGTFAAWLNHVDSKSINTLDTLVDVGGRKIVRHHLLDFGSTIGSAGVAPREPYEGREYLVEGKKTLAGIPSLGFYVKPWRTTPLYRAPSVGSFPMNNAKWDPEQWKPRYANSAFRSARLDDKFWAARRLQAVTTEMLTAVVRVGQFDDPPSEAALIAFLADRRDAIVRRYLPAVTPVVDIALSDTGTLTFRNAAADADVAGMPARYTANWQRFDNATHAVTPIATTSSPDGRPLIAAPPGLPTADGTYIRVDISASGGPESWSAPVHAYFQRRSSAWRLVGFERMPGGNPPHSGGARPSGRES